MAQQPTTEKTFPYRINKDYDIKLAPYQVLVVLNGFYCSGSLIGSRSVLTAAHCVFGGKTEDTLVKVGAESLSGDGQIIPCVDIRVHEYYGLESTIDNDIALLFLKVHVEFGERVQKTILLPPFFKNYHKTNRVLVTGWGHVDNGEHRLVMTNLTVVSHELCIKKYFNEYTTSMFCGRYPKEGCLIDSGNPAILKNHLAGIGVVSSECDEYGDNAVMAFTNVTYFYKWVRLNVERLVKKHCVPFNDKNHEEDYHDIYYSYN